MKRKFSEYDFIKNKSSLHDVHGGESDKVGRRRPTHIETDVRKSSEWKLNNSVNIGRKKEENIFEHSKNIYISKNKLSLGNRRPEKRANECVFAFSISATDDVTVLWIKWKIMQGVVAQEFNFPFSHFSLSIIALRSQRANCFPSEEFSFSHSVSRQMLCLRRRRLDSIFLSPAPFKRTR